MSTLAGGRPRGKDVVRRRSTELAAGHARRAPSGYSRERERRGAIEGDTGRIGRQVHALIVKQPEAQLTFARGKPMPYTFSSDDRMLRGERAATPAEARASARALAHELRQAASQEAPALGSTARRAYRGHLGGDR